jgi:hypothetical protein
MELLLGGRIGDVCEWLDVKLDEATMSVPYATLREALPQSRIEAAHAFLGAKSQHLDVRSERRDAEATVLGSKMITGSEVFLESTALRLCGKADRVRRCDDGVLEISDFKTGAITDTNGELKASYVLQVQAYGLMALELEPQTSLRLLLDNGEESAVPSDLDSLNAARDHILEFVARFPAGAMMPVEELASPGSECTRCGIRPSCTAYLTAAPDWWHDVPDEIGFAPADTWGEVKKFLPEGEHSVTLNLTDAAGRSVRVRRIDTRHGLRRESVGEAVYFFNLLADAVRRGFAGQRPHPRLFHELPGVEDPTARAWTVRVYG